MTQIRQFASEAAADADRMPEAGREPFMCCLARQPILDGAQNLHGYELLFRDGARNRFPNSRDPDAATCHVIDYYLVSHWPELTGGRPAFINCTRNILLSDVITLLPRECVVAEVLEDLPADPKTLAACQRLHRAGYRIALDDFVGSARSSRLLPYADLVKVDFLATTEAQQTAIAAEMRRRGIRLLAEKVESREQLLFAQRLGYDYFQGYYFGEPEQLRQRDASPACSAGYFEVLGLLSRDDYDVEKLEAAILGEPALCYRLLRYLELAQFELSNVRSMRHTLSLLGQRSLREVLTKLLQVTLCREYECWHELPEVARKSPRPVSTLLELAREAAGVRSEIVWH